MSSIIPAVRKEDQYSTGLKSSISQLQEFEYGMKENDGKTTYVNSVVTIDVQERSNKISPIFKTDNEPLDAVEQEKQRMARKAEKRHQQGQTKKGKNYDRKWTCSQLAQVAPAGWRRSRSRHSSLHDRS